MYDIEPILGSLFDDVIEQLPTEDADTSSLQRAGMDNTTPLDTVLNANGLYIFVTEIN